MSSSSTDGIILLAKQPGITSFSSLWQIKNALGTKKIGHTGTLDTFAEGLLVVLAGRYTRLVPYITDCSKEYLACLSFGRETDTLDPDGIVIREAELPRFSAINDVIPSFRGSILQKPPAYSAVHIDGQRASDRKRKGEAFDIPSREITIDSLEICSATAPDGFAADDSSLVSSMIIRVVCSKGTYIRSLARDIAQAAGSVCHLSALRRTVIGPFRLEDAAGFSMLSAFPATNGAVYGKGAKPPEADPMEIRKACIAFTPDLARMVGLPPLILDPAFHDSFLNGKELQSFWFEEIKHIGVFSVFCRDQFFGVISVGDRRLKYEFVIGHES